jgi:hypothetical protein
MVWYGMVWYGMVWLIVVCFGNVSTWWLIVVLSALVVTKPGYDRLSWIKKGDMSTYVFV